jgi:hypothetical protein
MYSSDLRASKAVMHARLDKALQRQEALTVLTEAGIDNRGWLARQTRWVLCGLGARLVELGNNLERRYRPIEPLSVES